MNDSKTVTNEMLYELIKEFKRDVNRRFEQQDARINRMERKVDDIYDSRDKVSVNFTRAWMFASFFLALLSATVVLAVDKAF